MRGTILSRGFEMPDRSGGLNCRACGAGGGRGVPALPCGHAGRMHLPRADRGFRAVLPEPAFLKFLLPFFPLPSPQTTRRKQSLKLSIAYYSKKPTAYGLESAKYTNGNRERGGRLSVHRG